MADSDQASLEEIKDLLLQMKEDKYTDVIGRKSVDKKLLAHVAIFILVLALLKFCLLKMGGDEPYIISPLCGAISFVIGTTLLTCLLMVFVPEDIVKSGSKLTSFI